MRPVQRALAPAALLLAVACASPGSPVGPRAPLRIELGTGRERFDALVEGARLQLVRGCQGAQHVWVAVRVAGLAREDAIVRLTLEHEGVPVSARFEARVPMRRLDGTWREVFGLTLVVPEPDGILGVPLVLRATLRETREAGARSAEAARVVSIAWGTSEGCVPIDAGARPDAGAFDAGARDAGASDAAAAPPPLRFTEVTAAAGITHVHSVGRTCAIPDDPACQLETMSGGVAIGDVDGDGWSDLFFTMIEAPNVLYRNRGDGTFEDVSASSGLGLETARSNGAAFVDVDADGDLDLYVTSIAAAGDPVHGRHRLWINDGTGRFTEDAVARGASLDDDLVFGGESVAVGDYDRDGYPDLHVNEWLPFGSERPHTRLLHNRGAVAPGTFEDVTRTSGALTFSESCWDQLGWTCSQYAFASAFSDLDDDGWPDLIVVQDFGLTRLFWNRGDGTFALGLLTRTIDGDENGMGSTIGDFDGDGDLDWFVTSIYDPIETCGTESCAWGTTGNRLYRYVGARTFVDGTEAAGVRDAGWGWGAVAFDADDDGDLDLLAVNGIDFPTVPLDDRFATDVTRFWLNDGSGVMTEVAAAVGLAARAGGKGVAVLDYDGDGDLDVVVASHGDRPRLYRNDGPGGSHLRVDCRTARGSPVLGARVSIRVRPGDGLQIREIGSPSHFLGQSERTAHFGLGEGVARVSELEVRWPNGSRTRQTDVAANQTLELVEP